MVLADLNADLDSSWGRQEDILAAKANKHGLVCETKQFRCRWKRRHMHGRWTFRRPNYMPEGERHWIHGKTDYALVKARDRRRVRSCRWVAMQHHNSDHRAFVTRVETDPAGVKRYEKDRHILPAPPLPRPLSHGDAMFAELVDAVEKPLVKERPENAWVRSGIWSLVDRRVELRKAGRLTQREARRLARAIRASLKLDRQERARKAGEAIMMELLVGNIKEAWRILKAWHRYADGAATKPCYASMER